MFRKMYMFSHVFSAFLKITFLKLPPFLLLKSLFAEIISACLGKIYISCNSMDFKDWSVLQGDSSC